MSDRTLQLEHTSKLDDDITACVAATAGDNPVIRSEPVADVDIAMPKAGYWPIPAEGRRLSCDGSLRWTTLVLLTARLSAVDPQRAGIPAE
jgi:hypothetical protein